MVLAVRRAGRLVALLPLCRERILSAGLPARRLHGATPSSWWWFDVVRAAGEEGAGALRALARFLGSLPGWDMLVLPDVPSGGAGEQLRDEAKALGHRVAAVELTRSPYVPLAGWDGTAEWWLRHVSGNFRSSMRRALKKTNGKLRLERVERADPDALQRLLDLEAQGWKGREGSALASRPESLAYFRALVAAAEQMGALVFHTLEHDGHLIAAQMGVVAAGRYSMLRIAHDESARQLAPGHLLTHAVLGDCAAKGLLEYDFTGKDDEWKRKWTPHVRTHAHQFIFARTLYGRALHAAKFQARPRLQRMFQPRVAGPA
jgi:CelD/BcsL family acetyltransferase involved in cellulose biosynthesis